MVIFHMINPDRARYTDFRTKVEAREEMAAQRKLEFRHERLLKLASV